jgi:hypothetical protein
VNNASSRARLVRLAAWLVVIAGVLNVCFLQIPHGSELRQALALLRSKHGPQKSEYAWCDELLKLPNGSVGNIWLDLGPLRTNQYTDEYLGMIYFRANYVLYPTRLYAAPSNHVINGGSDFSRNSPEPTSQWLRDHDVRFELTILKDKAGPARAEWRPLETGRASASEQSVTNRLH